jgi:hypothetical protein
MAIFAAFRRRTPTWDAGLDLTDQPGWPEHAAYMIKLAAEGVVLMAGPLGDNDGPLIVVRADSEEEVERRFAEDPWTRSGLLETEWIKAWHLRIGAPD